MRKALKKKSFNPNKSKVNEKLFKILSNIGLGIGGTVTYYYVEEILELNEAGDLVPAERKSFTHTKINSAIFTKEVRGKIMKRSYAEVLQVLQDTCDDMGATYFRIA